MIESDDVMTSMSEDRPGGNALKSCLRNITQSYYLRHEMKLFVTVVHIMVYVLIV